MGAGWTIWGRGLTFASRTTERVVGVGAPVLVLVVGCAAGKPRVEGSWSVVDVCSLSLLIQYVTSCEGKGGCKLCGLA